MKPHIERAHSLWSELLSEKDCVIDATCGNGQDTLALAKCVPKGHVYSYDIQKQAIDKAKELVKAYDNVTLLQKCHTEIEGKKIKLVVYNLGYLPGGDKTITTQVETTLESIQKAQSLLVPNGMISITCYPGHPEGKREQERLLEFASELSSKEWLCCHYNWVNRKNAPTLLIFQRLGALSAL